MHARTEVRVHIKSNSFYADLRQEIEYLKSLVGGGGAGHASNLVELQELREKLLESEKLMAEATRSWKEKLLETEARKREEMEELKVR